MKGQPKPFCFDEEPGPLYKSTPVVFGEQLHTVIHTTTPTTVTLKDFQFDHVSWSPPYRIVHDTVEEALRQR